MVEAGTDGQTNKRLHEQLASSQGIFRLLVDSVSDYAIFMLDPNGCVLTWNEGAERIKGYTSDEILGKHFSIFLTEDDKARAHPQHELEVAIAEGRYQEEGWRVRKDGNLFWAYVVITPVYENEILIGFAKVTRDLTERKQSERREEIFRLLVNSVADYAIFMLAPDGNVMTWNEGAQRITGYSSDDIIGKHFSIFYTKESRKRNHPQSELEQAKKVGRYEEEGWRLRKDGTLLWANVIITAIVDDGQLLGFAKVTRDLTQRLLADQEREMSAKVLDETNKELRRALDVKSAFLSTISHEVRTPMAGIIGLTEMLTLEDLGEDNNVIVTNVFQSSQRLLQLLNNLLDSARMESGELSLELRKFPVRAILGDVRQLVSAEAAKKELIIDGNCESSVPEFVVGDEMKVRQILLNLAHNAVKFTSAGTVTISATAREDKRGSINVRFSVTDTGIGIAADNREKLFAPFTQAEDATKRLYGGTGLGLSICKQLVEMMDGAIGFDSDADKGSTFWFALPFKAADSQ